MSNLIPMTNQGLATRQSRTISRRSQRRIQLVEERALELSAEILATEYVANVALDATAAVARDEIYHSAQLPGFEHRFNRIGEAQALSAARAVRDSGRS